MDTITKRQHWEEVFTTKDTTEVSWFQEVPTTSLKLIAEHCPHTEHWILDLGCGDSHLPHLLYPKGYEKIAVVDIAQSALDLSKQKWQIQHQVKYIQSDVLDLSIDKQVKLWHDRAVFHFITNPEDQQRYKQKVLSTLSEEGIAIIAAFSKQDGPLKCSGLEVCRHDYESIASIFEPECIFVDHFVETHITPSQKEQVFFWSVLKKK